MMFTHSSPVHSKCWIYLYNMNYNTSNNNAPYLADIANNLLLIGYV